MRYFVRGYIISDCFLQAQKEVNKPRYKDTLTEEERKELTKNYTKGKQSAHSVLSARALVLLDAGDGGPEKSNMEVSEATGLSLRTIDNLKRTFVEEGIEAVLDRRKRETPPRPVVFDGPGRPS